MGDCDLYALLNICSTSKSSGNYKEDDNFLKPKETVKSEKEIIYDNKNDDVEESHYNAFGRQINDLMQANCDLNSCIKLQSNKRSSLNNSALPLNDSILFKREENSLKNINKNVSLDIQITGGIKMKNPVISYQELAVKLHGVQTIPGNQIIRYLCQPESTEKANYIVFLVIIGTSPVKTSQKGSKYTIWKCTDLKSDAVTLSLFLFGNCYSSYYNIPVGTVIGVQNPSLLDKDQSSISVNAAQKIMILGKSVDFAMCSSKTKKGEPCNNFVNKSICEVCIYHAKAEYKKFGDKRTTLQNKLLGKNELYYGGNCYAAIPAKKSVKQATRDKSLLDKLSTKTLSSPAATSSSRLNFNKLKNKYSETPAFTAIKSQVSKHSAVSETIIHNTPERKNLPQVKNEVPKIKTLFERRLEAFNNVSSTESSAAISNKFEEKQQNTINSLSKLFIPHTSAHPKAVHAKNKALNIATKLGGFKKPDPNCTKTNKSSCEISSPSVKRQNEENSEITSNACNNKRLKSLMQMTSKHTDLINAAKNEAEDRYFNLAEKKEKIENKLLTTFQVDCKAVICVQCKYKAFSLSDYCKKLGHKSKVVDSVKRFFACKSCKNRTFSLEMLPTNPCTKCHAYQWEKAAMIKEKLANTTTLSICGIDEKKDGSDADNLLNLLVPE